MENKLELRMYFFVAQNISPIYAGIQSGHAALEYAFHHGDALNPLFHDFMLYHKTWVILNGGTTNDGHHGQDIGSLDQIELDLIENGIKYSRFCEPDLNNALTALCFLCDERVFNKKDYPDFDEESCSNYPLYNEIMLGVAHNEWVKSIGGEKNEFLRNLLKGKKLA